MVFGEISSSSLVNYEQIVRTAIKEIGYDDLKKGELIYNK
jgi:S-adenosylmethionine synthetase